MRRARLGSTVAMLLLGAPPAMAADGEERFALVNGCFALTAADGRAVGKVPGGYAAGAPRAEAFRMKATDLGRYLLYGRDADFLSTADGGATATALAPGPRADFEVNGDGPFTLTAATGGALGLGADGRLTSGGPPASFTFSPAEGCATFPEIGTSTSGTPSKGETPYSQTRGFIDAHMHLMAYEFLGGKAHCGKPWDRYGVTFALPDCNADPVGGVGNSVLEVALNGRPPGDQVGWPTFGAWPAFDALAHEASYFRWLERAWRGGLRMYVNLLVDNEALCNVYPVKGNPCDDMNSVRLQYRRTLELQDYIDAQSGGPGKGFFRIVKDPFEAREVVNDGKLAVVMGIEVSRLFGCGLTLGVPQCDKADIDRQLDEVQRMGVRQMEIINKFDNALGGVAGDSGAFGVAINAANLAQTGRFWDMATCDEEDPHVHDREQPLAGVPTQDAIFGAAFSVLLGGGKTPVYGPGPHCNQLGLSDLGAHLVGRMMDKGMIIDPDHLSVIARRELMSVVEARDYSGVVSSHSWSTPDAELRILRLGGFVAPYAGNSEGFVKKWRELQFMKEPRWKTAIGFGADANGFGTQGAPRPGNERNPVTYPFKSFDGAVTIDRQRSGEKVFDINTDGVAHYGLYPDWIEDLRKLAGDEIIDDLTGGAESYLQTWERAVGISPETCRQGRLRLRAGGLGNVRMGVPAQELLRGAGQPTTRVGRSWSYCVSGRGNGARRVRTAFAPDGRVALVGSNALRHRIDGVGAGSRASALRDFTRVRGTRLMVRRAGTTRRYVAGVSAAGRVRFVAVTTRRVADSPRRLRQTLTLAGLR